MAVFAVDPLANAAVSMQQNEVGGLELGASLHVQIRGKEWGKVVCSREKDWNVHSSEIPSFRQGARNSSFRLAMVSGLNFLS